MPNTLAYGFVGLERLASERVVTVGVDRIFSAITESAAEHNRQIDAMLSNLVARTTLHQEMFMLPGAGTMQPLDDKGNPKVVEEYGHYTVAYPIQGAGTAWGDNRVSRALMTVEEANRHTVENIKRDADWMIRHILASVFNNTAWVFTDKEFGALTVQPLANADAVTYVRVGGAAAVDTHYLFQAAAIADATNPFPTIYDELMEHPSNSGPVVVFVATSLKTSIQALTNFIPASDPDITLGVASDRLGSLIERGYGEEVLGKVDKCWIVEWRRLPAGYMFAQAMGAGPIVKMREYPVAALQGLFTENHSPDGNHAEYRMIRYAGFGVANRIGALCMQIGAGAYAIPAAYANIPLAV